MPLQSLSKTRWQFRDATKNTWLPASVPGCVHTDLRRAGKIPDPFFGTNELDLRWIENTNWEYRTRFQVSVGLLREEVIDLVAGGLDTVATVFLNGKEVARTENMFIGYRWNVKSLLRVGRNELVVHFRSAMDYVRRTRTDFTPPQEFNDPVGCSARIRKQPCQFGWDWGPRFVTAGIWRDLRLEAWTGNRFANVRLIQHHGQDGTVALELIPELARPDPYAAYAVTLSLEGSHVVAAEFAATDTGSRVIAIPRPQLWWPAGQGAQPLYTLHITARDAKGRELGVIKKRIGLRTVVLDRTADEWGESFRFVVNGRAIFLKGANWIPAHTFVAGLTRRDYERDLRAAREAHMNSLRVWGGGIYEDEHFYDLCDELGLLVWQDFMFACTLHPADRAFLASVQTEADYQVRRIRHHASLALWCGNNEIVMLNDSLRTNAELRRGYESIFKQILPESVATHDGVTAYWPSSPWRGEFEGEHTTGEKSGDTHYWDVWHARHPVKDYERWAFRFVSEFGMQSYSSPATNATFCPPDDRNIFGPAMENHQKNRSGNQIILDYVSRRYRYPKSQDDLIYLSQLNQAYCMQVGVEHYRRLVPRCMGALYWQLNDCWPVASWSSIEFTGRWKALHHAARRFFAPALVSAKIDGDERTTIGNYRQSTAENVELFTIYDAPSSARAKLGWEIHHFDGRCLRRREQIVRLRPGESVRQRTLELKSVLQKEGRDNVYLRLTLKIAGILVSEQSVFLSPPRFLALPRGTARVSLRATGPDCVELTFRSRVFLHAVCFDLPGISHRSSDNYFDLHPGVNKTIRLELSRRTSLADLRKLMRVHSLVDTYE